VLKNTTEAFQPEHHPKRMSVSPSIPPWCVYGLRGTNQFNKGGRKKKRRDASKSVPFLAAVAFFVMSPDGLFRFFFLLFLNSPCYETPKSAFKKKKHQKKSK
jgi:hypothetical protein